MRVCVIVDAIAGEQAGSGFEKTGGVLKTKQDWRRPKSLICG